jgi:hypothetical protein
VPGHETAAHSVAGIHVHADAEVMLNEALHASIIANSGRAVAVLAPRRKIR